MTRALLKRCNLELLSVLDSCNEEMPHHDGDEFHELLVDLGAELDKPEPTQPAWHDAPTQPGDWVIVGKGFKSELQTGITQQEIDRVSSWPGRWFGPLPEDTK